MLVSLVLAAMADASAAPLRGTITDPDGRAVSGARIAVVGPLGEVRSVVSDGAGRFAIDDVPRGHYRVHVVADGLSAEPQAIEVADQPLLELTIAARLAARTETLVVTAAQVDVPLSHAASSVSVLSGRELDVRQIATLGDALRLVPGLAVAQSGGRGGLTSVFTRGGESDYTLVMIDGVRTNSFGGGLDFAQLPLVGVDRIEIVRGPQSALFGSDAIGGVVQIVTRHGDRTAGDATLEGGSLGTWRGGASASGSRRAWSWHGAAQRYASDGFRGRAPATGEPVSNDDMDLRHAAGGGGWRADRGTDVRADVLVSRTSRGYPGPFGSNPIGSFPGVDRVSRGDNDRTQAGVHLLQPWFGASSRVRQRADVTWSRFTGRFASPFGDSESATRRLTARLQTDAALSASVGLSAGVEWLGERFGSTYITGERFEPVPIRRQVVGTFAELRAAPSARASITAGLRAERIAREALESSPGDFAPRPPLATTSVISVNPKIAAAVVVAGYSGGTAWTRLQASAGTGIRPPDAFEIAFTDNPGLRPERSRSVDGGIQQGLRGGALLLEATGFYNRYDDLIVAVARSLRDASRFRTDNISNARARGLELSAGWRPAPGADLRAAYTWLDSTILAVDRVSQAPPPFRIGEALVRRPRHQFSVDAVLARSRWTAYARAGGRGRELDIDPTYGAFGGRFDAAGYAVVHAGGSLRLARAVEFTVRLENLFDRSYEEVFGFPALGRTFLAGCRVAAGR